MTGEKKGLPNLEGATGFDLKIYGKDGDTLYDAGMFAADAAALTRIETVTVSAARTLAYMHLFCTGDEGERGFCLPHLRDFARKAEDFNLFINEED